MQGVVDVGKLGVGKPLRKEYMRVLWHQARHVLRWQGIGKIGWNKKGGEGHDFIYVQAADVNTRLFDVNNLSDGSGGDRVFFQISVEADLVADENGRAAD